MKQALQEVLGFPCDRIHELHEPATLDGGDVLFTGTSLWVGLSQRTNQEAVAQLKEILKGTGISVYAFHVKGKGPSETLHLKVSV